MERIIENRFLAAAFKVSAESEDYIATGERLLGRSLCPQELWEAACTAVVVEYLTMKKKDKELEIIERRTGVGDVRKPIDRRTPRKADDRRKGERRGA